MRLLVPMALVVLLFVVGLLASACGRLSAAQAAEPEVPWPVQMTCIKVRLTPEWLGARCENEEVICYVANGGLNCQWKPR